MGGLTDQDWATVRLTLDVAARSVSVGLPVAILFAALLTRRFVGRGVVDALVHLPIVLPPVVVGWLLLIMLGRRGVVGHWLYEAFGIALPFTTAGASVACAVMSLPLMIRAIRLSIESIDPGLSEAAKTLGAGALDRFFTVTLPLAAPGLLVGALVGFAACLGEFGAVITFAANIPGETQTLPLAIYDALDRPGGEATAARLSLVSVALALVLLLAADLANRAVRRRIGR